MRQIKLTKNSKYGKRGSVVYVSNNEAHSIIDKGFGKLYKRVSKEYKTTMLESDKGSVGRKRKYKTKKK